MAILPTDGRIALAKHLAAATIHFAWGIGESWWDSQHRSEIVLDEAGRAALPYPAIVSATLTDADSAVLYRTGADYILTNGGEIIRQLQGSMPALARLVVEYETGRPPLVGSEHHLMSEVGRRRANTVSFVIPDETGEIETPGGQRWRVSESPTRHLYLGAHFGFSDASDATIREIAVFTDTVTASGVPPGQLYLTPDEVEDLGCLLLLDRLKPIFRSPAETRSFAYVVTL